MLKPAFLFLSAFVAAVPTLAQSEPQEISYCTLAKDPAAYDRKMLRMRGTLSVSFENFTLWSKDCPKADPDIWLAFGGDISTPVASTFNDNDRAVGATVKVGNISYGIKKNEDLRRLNALISMHNLKAREPETSRSPYQATATLTGLFLYAKPGTLEGYGHLWCCSLFLITEVASVESEPVANLDVHGVVVGPKDKPLPGIIVLNDLATGAPAGRQQTVTDAAGAFSFSDAGQLVRVEDPRFRPQTTGVTPGGPSVQLRMEDAKRTDKIVYPCTNVSDKLRIGFSILFTVPNGWKSENFDEDEIHTIFVYPPDDAAPDAPFLVTQDRFRSEPTTYLYSTESEARWIKDEKGNPIGIDSRGRQRNGEYWRTVQYFQGDLALSNQFLRTRERRILAYRIMDSACIAPTNTAPR